MVVITTVFPWYYGNFPRPIPYIKDSRVASPGTLAWLCHMKLVTSLFSEQACFWCRWHQTHQRWQCAPTRDGELGLLTSVNINRPSLRTWYRLYIFKPRLSANSCSHEICLLGKTSIKNVFWAVFQSLYSPSNSLRILPN